MSQNSHVVVTYFSLKRAYDNQKVQTILTVPFHLLENVPQMTEKRQCSNRKTETSFGRRSRRDSSDRTRKVKDPAPGGGGLRGGLRVMQSRRTLSVFTGNHCNTKLLCRR